MALNISLFWLGWPVFLAALILVLILIIVLTVVERRIHKRVEQKKSFEQTYYQRKLGAIKTLKSEKEILGSIDEVAKEFFEEKYRPRNPQGKDIKAEDFAGKFFKDDQVVNKNSSYSDLVDFFKERNDAKAVEFSKAMVEALYSGEKLSKAKLDKLYMMLEKIVGEKPIIPEKKPEVQQPKVVGVPTKAPVKQSMSVPMKQAINVDKNSGQKIKMVLQNRKPIEPVKSQIEINRERVESVESLGPAQETVVRGNVPVQARPSEKKGFFARLFGKKNEPTRVIVAREVQPLMKKDVSIVNSKKEIMNAPVKKQEKKVNMDLVNYIKEGNRRGFDVGLLKKKLIDAGFKKEDVEGAAHYFVDQRSQKMSPAIKNNLIEEKVNPVEKQQVVQRREDVVEKKEEVNPEEENPIGGKKKQIYSAFPQQDRRPIPQQEKKGFFQKIFSPKNKDLDRIKMEVQKSGEVKTESSNKQTAQSPREKSEDEGSDHIGSMDNLDRVKKRIEQKQEYLTQHGYKGAELAKLD
jgi:hypothetical protein